MSPLASQGASDPAAWGAAIGNLGPIGMIVIPLVFALAVIIVVALASTIALTGIRRFGVPGLAYVLGGLWRELHGLRMDLRAWSSGDELPPLEPLDEKRSLFPPPRKPSPVPQPEQPERVASPPSRRTKERPDRR